MQFGTFITDLASKAGISSDDKSIKDLQAANLTIPDEIASKISESLFNIDSAKQNSVLKGYFHSQALSVPDKTIDELTSDFDDVTKSEFASEKNTPAKIRLLVKKIQSKNEKLIEELQKKGAGKDGQERIEKLTSEISKLNTELAKKDDEWKARLQAEQAKAESDRLAFAQKGYLATKKYANEKQSQDLNIEFANLVLERRLAEKKAKVIMKDGKPKLVQADNPDLEYQENHKPVSFEDFTTKVLNNDNLLFVTDPKKVSNGQTVVHQGNGKTLDVSPVTDANTAMIAQLEKAQAQ